jgi:hypothetical protein
MKKTTLLFQFRILIVTFLLGVTGNAQIGTLCTNPIVITTLPYTTTDNTANYADNYDPPTATSIACGAGVAGNYYLGGNDVIYSFTSPLNGVLNLEIPSAPAWTGFFVFTSCANIGVTVYACNCSSGSGNRTISNMSVVTGQTYYIVISSWPAPQTIAYTLNVSGVFLGSDDFTNSAVTTYPNPVKDYLQISNPNQNISEVTVYNLFGQEVIKEDWTAKNTTSLDMTRLASGTYLLTVSIDGKTETKKIVKM